MCIHRGVARLLGATLVLLSGCAAVSHTEGLREVQKHVAGSDALASPIVSGEPAEAADARVAELLRSPLTVSAAVEVALLRNPQIAESYAEVGLSQADVIAASRISNPVFSGSLITGGGERQAVGGISQSISDLLLLADRRRLAKAGDQRNRSIVTHSMIDLLRDVQGAWYRSVSAEQVAKLRAAIATSADVSATLAQRFYDAGNISELDLTLNRAAATQAHLAALQATVAAQATKYDLQSRLGLRGTPTWSIASELPAPSPVAETPDSLVALAQEHRGDLRAAHQEVTQLDDALRVAKRWRWLGVAEVGVQREREPDGRVLTGPTVALALPLFNQGQAGIARGEAELEISLARLQSLEASVENTIRLDVDRVAAVREVAEAYRQTLVPEHALIVKREQERQNFMLIGQFELLMAKQQEYDTYQKYLEAVRDYWLARVELERAIGTDLKSGPNAAAPSVSAEDILKAPAGETGHMEHHHGETPQDTEHHHHEGMPMLNMPDMPNMHPPEKHPSPDHPDAAPPGDHR